MKTAARLAMFAVIAAAIPWIASSEIAAARDCTGTVSTSTLSNAFTAHADAACAPTPGGATTASADSPKGTWETAPVSCAAAPNLPCKNGQRLCPNGDFMTISWFETEQHAILWPSNNCDDPTVAPGPTSADILRAFQQIPLPQSRLVIQPPGGATLVNFETNFYTQAAPFERTVALLGHQVHFNIKTQSFTWRFGDHTEKTTSKPGAAYPTLDITHRYLKKGTVAPSVDTTWEADYQLDGGAWAPVEGTVTMHGTPQQLTIKSATPVLVG